MNSRDEEEPHQYESIELGGKEVLVDKIKLVCLWFNIDTHNVRISAQH